MIGVPFETGLHSDHDTDHGCIMTDYDAMVMRFGQRIDIAGCNGG